MGGTAGPQPGLEAPGRRAVGQSSCSVNRDSKFTAGFDEVLRTEGVKMVRLPYRAPRANSIAERIVGSARRECLDHLLGIFGPRHLKKVLAEYIDHYNHARPHQGIEQR